MIEHSVPQNVTSYQFHLIGNMTIKQFLLLLVGVGAGGLLYTTNIIGIIKWPLIIIFVLIGIAMAFVPYEERSLDQWIVNFIKAMYRPTKFFWRRMGQPPELFSFSPRSGNQAVSVRPGTTTVNRRRQVNQYLSTLKPAADQSASSDPLDLFGGDTSGINTLFDTVSAAKNVVPSEDVAAKPKLGVRSRPLAEQSAPTGQIQSEIAVNTVASPVQTPPAPEFTIEPVAAPIEAPNATNTLRHPGETTLNSVGTVSVEPQTHTLPFQAEKNQTQPNQVATAPSAYSEAMNVTQAQTPTNSEIVPVVFNRALPFPSLPTQPNILIGMVYNASGSILPNAILEILNEQGNTVRALRTNSLGQFYTSTPLPAGNYIIEVEIDGHDFPKFSLQTQNTVLDPIEIRPAAQT